MLFLESGKTLTIKLPPFREKSFADQKNPYFMPVSFWIMTENKLDLNQKTSDFTLSSNKLTDKYFNQLYFQQSRAIFDSVVSVLDREFPENTPVAFQKLKELTIKMIEVDAFRQKPEKYSALFSAIDDRYWLHPAFINLFEKTFGEQLDFKAKSINGQKITDAVDNSDMVFLLKFVRETYNIDGHMADLALLKMLYDGFYSGYFSKSAVNTLTVERCCTTTPLGFPVEPDV